MPKRQVSIALARFWSPEVRVEGLFAGLPYLFDHFEFVPSDRPDFVLFGESPGDLPPGVAEHTARLAVAPEAPFGTEWAGLLRKLDRMDPSYRT